MTGNTFASIVMVLFFLFLCYVCETGLLRLPYLFADRWTSVVNCYGESVFITSGFKQECYRKKCTLVSLTVSDNTVVILSNVPVA